MDTNETIVASRGQVPGWLDEQPNEALRAFYAPLPRDVVEVCEGARQGMRESWVNGLVAAHDALAPTGGFKDWCKAAGINIRTAQGIVYREDKKRKAKEQAGDTSNEDGSLGGESADDESEDESEDDKPKDKPKGKPQPSRKKAGLTIWLEDTTAKGDLTQALRGVCAAQGADDDDFGQAVLYLYQFWFAHQQERAA